MSTRLRGWYAWYRIDESGGFVGMSYAEDMSFFDARIHVRQSYDEEALVVPVRYREDCIAALTTSLQELCR